MATYKIGLARTYLITVQAENPESAMRLSESFVGESNLSMPNDRQEHRFAIDGIEIVDHDAFECDDV